MVSRGYYVDLLSQKGLQVEFWCRVGLGAAVMVVGAAVVRA